MKKKILLVFFLVFIINFIYFRWFNYSISIINNTLDFNLPDFINNNTLVKSGFSRDLEYYIAWDKFDYFNLIIRGTVISDSLWLIITTGFDEYPFVNNYFMTDVPPQFDAQLTELLKSNLDSVRTINMYDSDSSVLGVAAEFEEYYTINPNLRLIRRVVKYKEVVQNGILIKPKEPDGILLMFENPNEINKFYRFCARLPFILSFDPLAPIFF